MLLFGRPVDMTDDVSQSPPRRYLTTQEAADYLRLKKNSLEKMRWQGRGPMFRHHGRNVVYAIEDLDAWSNKRTSNSTSDPDGKDNDRRPNGGAGALDNESGPSVPDAERHSDV